MYSIENWIKLLVQCLLYGKHLDRTTFCVTLSMHVRIIICMDKIISIQFNKNYMKCA